MKKPFINALLAFAYIALVVGVINFGEAKIGPANKILAPMAMLSLFVLSVTMMGVLFLGKPLMLYLDGQKKEAVRFFLTTVAIFACITVFALLAMFLGA